MQVRCSSCEWIDTEEVETVVNIEEDIHGRDIVTFICPRCGDEETSMVVDK